MDVDAVKGNLDTRMEGFSGDHVGKLFGGSEVEGFEMKDDKQDDDMIAGAAKKSGKRVKEENDEDEPGSTKKARISASGEPLKTPVKDKDSRVNHLRLGSADVTLAGVTAGKELYGERASREDIITSAEKETDDFRVLVKTMRVRFGALGLITGQHNLLDAMKMITGGEGLPDKVAESDCSSDLKDGETLICKHSALLKNAGLTQPVTGYSELRTWAQLAEEVDLLGEDCVDGDDFKIAKINWQKEITKHCELTRAAKQAGLDLKSRKTALEKKKFWG
jgi:hypothetical protein